MKTPAKHIAGWLFAGSILFSGAGCERDAHLSPDYGRGDLLPDTGDYLDEDYGTQHLAEEVAGTFDGMIGLIYYDAETRTIPQLYLTQGEKEIGFTGQPSGAVELDFEGFNTPFMPLELSVRIKVLLDERGDTILMRGTDGIVRTANPGGEIGTPLPESDDAELTGYYLRPEKSLHLLIDLMLPVPVKATVKGTKQP